MQKYFNAYNLGSPCKDCQERCLHCHSKCEKYRKFKERLNNVDNGEKLAVAQTIEAYAEFKRRKKFI